MVSHRRKAIFSRPNLSNNHALLFFQGITAARKDDRKRKLSAGMAVGVRQRTVFL
jgi:hypothetical protein